MNKKGKNPQHKAKLEDASDVLQSLLGKGKGPLAQSFTRWKLWSNWSQVVGPSMAEHSAPVDYYKGCLVVWVDSSARLQEMVFLVRQIRDQINEYVGRKWIRSIKFTLDRHHVPQQDEVSKGFHKAINEFK